MYTKIPWLHNEYNQIETVLEVVTSTGSKFSSHDQLITDLHMETGSATKENLTFNQQWAHRKPLESKGKQLPSTQT